MAWRQMDEDGFLEAIAVAHRRREALGRERYGPQFVGNPLMHAWEEALDLLRYLYTEMRRQSIDPLEASPWEEIKEHDDPR